MGVRLSKISTRSGDQGTTSLGNGERVGKDDARVEAFGTVDELNSVLGMLLAHALPETMRSHLTRVQHDLFEVGGELCIPGHTMIKPADCERLEQIIDHFNADLPPLKEFILPGGTTTAAACHLARAVCRRAERRVVTLARTETVNQQALIYLKRQTEQQNVQAQDKFKKEVAREKKWRRNWN